MINLSSFLRFHAIRWPDRLAIVYGNERLTYGDLFDRMRQLAAFLHEKGVGEGDVVGVFMKNSAAFLEIAFATSYLGAVFLPLNYRLAVAEAEYIVDNAGAVLVFGDEEFGDVLSAIENVQLVGEAAQHDMRSLTGRAEVIPDEAVRQPADLFRLMYTSGTTDRPKGVMHSYDNFYWKCMDHVMSLELTPASRLLVAGPLYHVGAFDLPGLAVLWMGGMMCVHRDFDAGRVLASIRDEKLTGAWLAPVMLTQILGHPDRGDYNVTSLQWCIGGGEKTPEARIRGFSDYFTQGRYIDAYGLTETGSGDTLMEPGMEIEKIGSTGRALAHVQIAIMDDAGATLTPGMEGEICLRGPKIAAGYWKDRENTARAHHGDWFRTGDVGYLDADGFLYLTDRKKDLIISGGENIASSEVERVIYMLPEVKEAAVIGVPDERWGETPIAVVVCNPGQALEPEQVTKHCGQHLAGFKVPKRVILRDDLPRNPSGKVLKRSLREEYGREEYGGAQPPAAQP